jgi:hypothetical protein
MKKFFIFLLSLTLFVSFGMLAQARPEGKGGPPQKGGKCREHKDHLKKMDADKDGKISLQEWQDFHAKKFKDKDKNGDGFLSGDELKPPKGQHHDK